MKDTPFFSGVWIVNMISEIFFDNDVVFLPSGLVVSPVKRQSTCINWLLVALIYQYLHMEWCILRSLL